MPERLRQPRHSRVSQCPREIAGARAVVRVALLCGLALSGEGCPAVLDLERDPDASEDEGPEPDSPDLQTEPAPSVADAAVLGVNPVSPRIEGVDAPCRGGAPPAFQDGGGPAAAEPGQGRALGAATGPESALRAVLAAGYVLPCGSEQSRVLQLPDGSYQVSALGHTGLCPPFETMLYRLRVSKSGQITVLDAIKVNPAQVRCDAGEPQLTQEPSAPPLA